MDLFDGVMGQCVAATAHGVLRRARRVVTSLNTHILHLVHVMRDEARRAGSSSTGFVSARMVERLRLLHADAGLAGRMGVAAPASVAHLSYDNHTAAVRRLYQQVLG